MGVIVFGGQTGGKALIQSIMKLGHTYEEALSFLDEMRAIIGNYETPYQVGAGLHEIEKFFKEHSSEKELSSKLYDDTDPPKNLLHIDPPKQKKHRSNIPDKRIINRKNRKRK